MNDFAYLPSTGEGFVELSRTKSGKLFKKHVLSKGELLYPGVAGGKVDVTDEFLATVASNFTAKVCDIVQVPVANDRNEHTEDPFRNIGEVVDFKVEDGKGYAYIDARDEGAADKLGKTLLGASAMMNLDYTDTRTGEKVGPTLLHVAVTNRPYIVELEDYEEVLAASNVSEQPVFLTQSLKETPMPTRDEMIAALKTDHNIDVADLQKKVTDGVALSNSDEIVSKLATALTSAGVIKLSNPSDTPSGADVVGAVAELANKNVELSNTVKTANERLDAVELSAKTTAAENRVDGLVRDGFIVPAKKDVSVRLLLSNPADFEEMLPEKPIVSLSREVTRDDVETPTETLASEELEGLVALSASLGYGSK